jgi:hypothetical protein
MRINCIIGYPTYVQVFNEAPLVHLSLWLGPPVRSYQFTIILYELYVSFLLYSIKLDFQSVSSQSSLKSFRGADLTYLLSESIIFYSQNAMSGAVVNIMTKPLAR